MATIKATKYKRTPKKVSKTKRRRIELQFSKVGYTENSYFGNLMEKYNRLEVVVDD